MEEIKLGKAYQRDLVVDKRYPVIRTGEQEDKKYVRGDILDANAVQQLIDNSGGFDPQEYYDKQYIDENFLEILVSGENIKTINNLSLLGSGNIDIEGGNTWDTEIIECNITSVDNSGVATVDNPNWAYEAEAAYNANKLPVVKGSYGYCSFAIPITVTEGSPYYDCKGSTATTIYIGSGLSKTYVFDFSTNGGSLYIYVMELQEKLTFDDTPTTGSSNPVKSSGVKTYVDGVANMVPVTYSELVTLKNTSQLVEGRFYRITDFVTTVNGAFITNARSAGHPFDILVRADSVSTLNEQAWAVRHDGDTYFKDARLEAWELKYRLDNVQWSKQAGTYVTDEDNGYTFLVIGDITLSGHTYKLLQGFGTYVLDWSDYALMETVAEGETIYCYFGHPEDFDPEEPEVVGTASGVEEVTEAGKGTITWMKDEHGNECPYDFKNILFKRYMATDSVSGREELGGKYMVADPDNLPQGLSVEDTEDFIWAYTFSSDNSGGEQTDYSLTAEHEVHDNVFRPYSGGLTNNVMFGKYICGNEFEVDCYDNSFDSYFAGNSIGSFFQRNSIGSGVLDNSIGSNMYGNSIGSNFTGNSIGSDFQRNSIDSGVLDNSIGSNMYGNSIGSNFTGNSIGSDFQRNSIDSGFRYNSIGSNFTGNSIGSDYQCNTVDEGVQYTTTGDDIKYVHVLNGVAGTSSSKLTLTFAANKTYCQMAAKTTAGVLKIWVPADLV